MTPIDPAVAAEALSDPQPGDPTVEQLGNVPGPTREQQLLMRARILDRLVR
ncbi:hypothetical protein ACFXGA_06190 [Actinosynnema sp. NPDC059335]|uniref:hypothetical protein n=1 Tax=Actinosynnema sp. NPDC059335 TaxID=3346804 RepID=UPI0036720E0D